MPLWDVYLITYRAAPVLKDKFLVVMYEPAEQDYLMGFLINTLGRSGLRNVEECEIVVDAEHHAFLSYDSFLAVHETQTIPKSDIQQVLGRLSPECQEQAKQAVRQCRVLRRKTKALLEKNF